MTSKAKYYKKTFLSLLVMAVLLGGAFTDKSSGTLKMPVGARQTTVLLLLSSIDIRTQARSTRRSQAVTHPSTLLPQCCLTSVLEWVLMPPT